MKTITTLMLYAESDHKGWSEPLDLNTENACYCYALDYELNDNNIKENTSYYIKDLNTGNTWRGEFTAKHDKEYQIYLY